MKETELLKQIQLAFTNLGARLFRNNTGLGWAGRSQVFAYETMVKVGPGDVVIRQARPLHAGLCIGSSDLIGWNKQLITEAHIGREVAIFTAIEGKTGTTRLTKEQESFLSAVRSSGGNAGVVRSVDDAVEVISGF